MRVSWSLYYQKNFFLRPAWTVFYSYKSLLLHYSSQISFLDITASVIKALVFGFTIGITGCYQGYNTTQGTQGVGKAANSAVVISMFLIFIEEMLIVQIVNSLRPQ